MAETFQHLSCGRPASRARGNDVDVTELPVPEHYQRSLEQIRQAPRTGRKVTLAEQDS
jgi:hypothetical protein